MERSKHQIAGQSEIVHVIYTDPKTNERDAEFFGMGVVVNNGTGIPIVPHSWYHVCMGLDTVSGLLRIVVNGVVMVNEEKEYFRNTKQWKPKSLEGKLLLFKSFMGFWYQHRSIMSNMNIFSSMMSVENMIRRTTGGDDCSSTGDYIRQEMIPILFTKIIL